MIRKHSPLEYGPSFWVLHFLCEYNIAVKSNVKHWELILPLCVHTTKCHKCLCDQLSTVIQNHQRNSLSCHAFHSDFSLFRFLYDVFHNFIFSVFVQQTHYFFLVIGIYSNKSLWGDRSPKLPSRHNNICLWINQRRYWRPDLFS